jgi:hypothetical protein
MIHVLNYSTIPIVKITIPPDNEVYVFDRENFIFRNFFLQTVLEFNLQQCSYVADSSESSSGEYIRINSKEEQLIIFDQLKECTKLLEFIRSYMQGEYDEVPDPAIKEKVEQFITALNKGDSNTAVTCARDLVSSGKRSTIRFYLDKIYGSDRTTPDKLLK